MVFAVASVEALREVRDRNWSASTVLFVSAVPYGPPPTAATGLFSYESEAGRMAQDLSQVATSRDLASNLFASPRLAALGLSVGTVKNDLGAISTGRTLTVTATAPTAAEANLIDHLAQTQLIAFRARYVGAFEAVRSDVSVISPPAAARSATGHILASWLLRVLLGAVVALAIALVWDYLDDSVHSASDLERCLDAPVLARILMTVESELKDSSKEESTAVATPRAHIRSKSSDQGALQLAARDVLVSLQLRYPDLRSVLISAVGCAGAEPLASAIAAEWASILARIVIRVHLGLGRAELGVATDADEFRFEDPAYFADVTRIREAFGSATSRGMVVASTEDFVRIHESRVLAAMVEGVIFVVRAGVSRYPDLREAEEQLSQVDARLLGSIYLERKL